jgi:hypothetical protein
MSLKTDYLEGLTGLTQQADAAFVAGQGFITANLTQLSTDLKAQAALGMTNFTITYTTTFNPTALRGNKGNNLILKAYLAGILDGMASQNIYNYEVNALLNVSLCKRPLFNLS